VIPPVVILAGGLATRLYPTTLTRPKSLVEVAGYPFIYHQLKLLKEKGVKEVVLCVGKYGDLIIDYVGDGEQWGINVQYSRDGPSLLGTGGAIKNALALVPDNFMIMYGDSYLDTDFSAVSDTFTREKLPVLMTIYHNTDRYDKSNISMKNGKIVKYDKINRNPEMEFIDYGLMVVRKEIFGPCPPDIPFDLSVVLSEMVEKGLVAAFVVPTRFYEIGSPAGIDETGQYICNRKKNNN